VHPSPSAALALPRSKPIQRKPASRNLSLPALAPPDTMAASSPLLSHWRSLDDAALLATLKAARQSVAAFAAVTASAGSLLQSWIDGQEVLEFEHYPANDVIDRRRGSQFYYHAHRDGDLEHGHVHLFFHATASGKRRYLPPDQGGWRRSAPSHLFAISLDARGLPVALFTVNQWVTDGYWFDARATLACVDRFQAHAVPGHELSCAWITGFTRLYRPLVEQLLQQRDRRLAQAGPLGAALKDHSREVLSFSRIDWTADLDALETLARLRMSINGDG